MTLVDVQTGRAFAPASVTNLGMGFDVVGMAIRGPGDTVAVSIDRRSDGIRVEVEGDDGSIPLDPERNTAAVAACATLERAGVTAGIEVRLKKGMPVGSGLGSSAASAAAAATATNLALGGPLRRVDLIGPCIEAEAVVSGRHADNVAAAVLGGLILVRSLDPLDVVRLPVPEGLTVVVVTPCHEVLTRDARAVLPEQVSLATTVRQMADVGAFVSACFMNDLDLLSRCMTDELAEPHRTGLIPGGAAVIEAARGCGALGSSISGAGPSIFALCRSRDSAAHVERAMVRAFESNDMDTTSVVSPADCPGARQL